MKQLICLVIEIEANVHKEIWQICTDVFIVLLPVVISSCSFYQIEGKIASYTVDNHCCPYI